MWAPEDPEALRGSAIDAFVLGYSLKRHGSTHDRVLLATEDVMRSPLVDALRLFWEVRPIKHVRVGEHLSIYVYMYICIYVYMYICIYVYM